MDVETYASIEVARTEVELWRGREAGWFTAALRLTGHDGSTVTLRAQGIWQLRNGVDADVDGLLLSALSDVTGNGVPDLVVKTYAGGASCCFGLYVFELGEVPRVLVMSSARVDEGWDLIDLTGDGRLELVDGDGFRRYCATGIGGTYAAARYDTSIRADRLASAELLANEGIATSLIELSDGILAHAARSSDAYQLSCWIASEALPPLIAGLVDVDDVRTLLAASEIRDLLPSEGFAKRLIASALAHPRAFLPDSGPWQRVVVPEQVFWRSCNALHQVLAAVSTDAVIEDADPVAASVNRQVFAAYVERIRCDGPELTSLAPRNGVADDRCLQATLREPECDDVGTTALTVLAETAVDAVAARLGADVIHDADDLWHAAYEACDRGEGRAREAAARLWSTMIDRLRHAGETSPRQRPES